MADRFAGSAASLVSPASYVEVVSPSDSEELEWISRGLSIATAGALSLLMADDSTAVVPSGGLAPGIVHPLRVKRVNFTGTSATGITAYGTSSPPIAMVQESGQLIFDEGGETIILEQNE